MEKVEVFETALMQSEHQDAYFELLNGYMSDPMGEAKPHSPIEKSFLIQGVKNQNGCIILAKYQNKYIGFASCFFGFSTFKLQPLLNIHDIYVKKEFRGNGVSKKILNKIEEVAIANNCCKITLEVRQDNDNAQKVYEKFGFRDFNPPMFFQAKEL